MHTPVLTELQIILKRGTIRSVLASHACYITCPPLPKRCRYLVWFCSAEAGSPHHAPEGQAQLYHNLVAHWKQNKPEWLKSWSAFAKALNCGRLESSKSQLSKRLMAMATDPRLLTQKGFRQVLLLHWCVSLVWLFQHQLSCLTGSSVRI